MNIKAEEIKNAFHDEMWITNVKIVAALIMPGFAYMYFVRNTLLSQDIYIVVLLSIMFSMFYFVFINTIIKIRNPYEKILQNSLNYLSEKEYQYEKYIEELHKMNTERETIYKNFQENTEIKNRCLNLDFESQQIGTEINIGLDRIKKLKNSLNPNYFIAQLAADIALSGVFTASWIVNNPLILEKSSLTNVLLFQVVQYGYPIAFIFVLNISHVLSGQKYIHRMRNRE